MVYRPESLLERLELLRQYGADLSITKYSPNGSK